MLSNNVGSSTREEFIIIQLATIYKRFLFVSDASEISLSQIPIGENAIVNYSKEEERQKERKQKIYVIDFKI